MEKPKDGFEHEDEESKLINGDHQPMNDNITNNKPHYKLAAELQESNKYYSSTGSTRSKIQVEKLKSLVIRYLKAEKLKGFNRLKLWTFGLATVALLLFACLLQLTTLTEFMRQPGSTLPSSHEQIGLPPESEYLIITS